MKLSLVLPALAIGGLLFFAGNAPAASIPDLTGKWETKSYSHHHESRGFAFASKAVGKWTIKDQQGRLFHGERTYIRTKYDGMEITEGFSGTISRDGKRIYMVDHNEDILFGDILKNGSIELVIMNDGDQDKHSKIGLIEIEKVR